MSRMDALRARYTAQAEPLRTERRIELVVLCLAGLLLLQLVVNAIDLLFAPDPAPVIPSAESLQVGAIDSQGRVDEALRAEIRGRPLFFEGRRPLENTVSVEEEKKTTKRAAKRPKLKLVGVFGAAGDKGIIALNNGKQLRLLVGEDVDGWKLASVATDEVVLTSGGESWELGLERSALGISVAVPAPAPKQNDAVPAEQPQHRAPQTRPAQAPPPAPSGDGELVLGGRR